MKKSDKKFRLITSVLIFVFALGMIFLISTEAENSASDSKLQKLADKVEEDCSDSSWKPGCYDEEIPKLMSSVSMEDAFKVVKLIQKKDDRYLYCHVVAHKLSYQEAAKNPDAWKDVITRCPTSFCNNGCLHGSLMERFNSEILTDEQIEFIKPDLMDVCEPRGDWNPVEMERSMCYHGLGHMFMFITDANINKALDLCELVSKKEDGRNYMQTCSQGVFMILYQPIEPEDFALIEKIAPKNIKERDQLCSNYNDLYFKSCIVESWPLFINKVLEYNNGDKIANAIELTKACNFVPNSDVEINCYENWFSVLATELLITSKDPKDEYRKYFDLCLNLPDRMKGKCFDYGAYRLMQIDPVYEDKALGLCAKAQTYGFGDGCYTRLIRDSIYFFKSDSVEFKQYCESFPVSWTEKCLNMEGY